MLQAIVAAGACLATVFAPAEPASAVAAPAGVSVHFSDSAATITWREVPGSQGYGVVIRPMGVQGPYGEEEVLGDRYTVPFDRFPGYGKYKKGYAYVVCSFSKQGKQTCTTVSDGFYVTSQGHGVSTSNLHKAAHKASSCLAEGAKAAIVTAAGGGFLAAMVSWIPGVDAITAADVGYSVAKAGAGTFMTCVVS